MNYPVVVNRPVAKWDIFCRIVDNYGDIGVCWRLAKQLTNEHRLIVKLFIDLPEVAQKIIPDLNLTLIQQRISGVEIYIWNDALFSKDNFAEDVADVVIEAFACDLPQQYAASIQSQKSQTFNGKQSTIWLNLEYLSAEKWVDDFHAKSSVNPKTGVIKHYFFPGFYQSTGGLLREGGLIIKRDTFQASNSLQLAFLQQFHVNIISLHVIKISLFCYPHAPLLDLLHILSTGNTQVSLFVPGNEILTTIARFLHVENINLKVGREYKKGCLSIHIMPFLSQDEYDQLLWCCDINFVRGEDSWVRAILAGKPFIWQPYFQQEESHIVKLNAFLDEYSQLLEVFASKALQQLNHAWIYPNPNDLAIYWVGYIQQLEVYKAHAQIYTKRLSEQDDLATKLVEFCNK